MTTVVQPRERTGRTVSVRQDATVGLVALVAALVAWSAWRVGGLDLAVRRGSGETTVGVASVAVTVLLAAIAGTALLRVLEARTARGLRTWTIVALVVFALSLLGPLGAVSVSAGLALVSLHAVVASILLVGLRRSRRRDA